MTFKSRKRFIILIKAYIQNIKLKTNIIIDKNIANVLVYEITFYEKKGKMSIETNIETIEGVLKLKKLYITTNKISNFNLRARKDLFKSYLFNI